MLKKISSIFVLIMLCTVSVHAECVLNEVPSPPIDSYIKNMDVLIDAVKSAAEKSVCTKSEGQSSYYDVAYVINSIESLLLTVHSASYNLGSLISDTRYYFDSSGTMILPILLEHQKSILEIQKKITEAGIAVGNLCAQGTVVFDQDVEMEGSLYKTKGFNLEEVLTEMYAQTTHVLIFYRNLATNVSDREYVDETHFPIAPAGFAKGMREFYSSKNIQACHDEDPKNIGIKEAIKKGFTIGWKYPQAVQIWKEAFALLLYRGKQVFGSDEVDPAKEAEILKIIAAQKGGLSNSRVLNGKTLTDEFKRNPKNLTIREQVTESSKRIAYETFGRLFQRQAIPDVVEENKNNGTANIPEFPENDADATTLAALDKQNYTDYARRNLNVGNDKGKNQDLGVGLVDALNEAQQLTPLVHEMANTVCRAYDKQAKNVQQMYGIADCSYFFKP